MNLSSWKNKGQYFSYRSHPIFTIDEGRGEVMLLIHGFPTSSWDWWQVWDRLISDYRVLTLDMLGFGFSAKPPKYPYSILDQADLIEQWLEEKGIHKLQILSHDYGDTVAQELLARYESCLGNEEMKPEIASICFLNGGLFPETHRALPIQHILMSPLGGLVGRFFSRQRLGQNFKKIFGPDTQPTEAELDAFWEVMSHNEGRKVFHLLIRYMQERKDHRARWVGAMQQTRVPMRLINGVVDPISGQHVVDRYKEIIPAPDVVELVDIGHFPLIEASDLVLKHYLDFIRSR
ncbi:MAG: alpha/beta hydrolase [Bacteroidota bacterium]